jgi:hypothetical protein
MFNNGDGDGEDELNLLLSLVERSVDLVVVDDDDNCLGSFATTTELSPFKGNLYKICFRKKKLLASLKYWINAKVGTAKCLSSASSLTSYIEHAQADNYFKHQVKPGQGPEEPKVPEHLQQFPLETSLDVYQNGRLFEGVVLDNPTSKMGHKKAILCCAGKLYRHLWFLRSIIGKNVSYALGYSVCYGTNSENGEWIALSTMRLEIFNSGSQIGAKPQLFVHTQRQALNPTTTLSKICVVENLGKFLLASHQPHPSNSELLSNRYPGATMLLSEQLRRKVEDENEDTPCHFIPTITGSMVMRCRDLDTVRRVLFTIVDSKQNYSPADINLHLAQLMESLHETELAANWFIKCKTPASFGTFWETADVAITGTRRRLKCMLRQQKKSLSKEQVATANEWLTLYPLDSILEPHRNITILRDMGIKFIGQLAWSDFKSAFLSFVRRTLLFQNMTKLIHGDIYEGNLLLKNDQLVLIDWDEALREKACFRQTLTDKEKLRYPNELVDFPEIYTKHQLVVLFDFLLDRYYPDQRQSHHQLELNLEVENRELLVAVRTRFKILDKFLAKKS